MLKNVMYTNCNIVAIRLNFMAKIREANATLWRLVYLAKINTSTSE